VTDARWPADPLARERVLLVVAGDRDRELLAEWLEPEYEVETPTSTEAWGEFDACLVDRQRYAAVQGRLVDRRRLVAPAYLPVLLLGEGDGSGALDGPADDVVAVPTRKATLRTRLESLLRARRLSLALHAERDQLELYRRAMDEATVGISIADADDDQPLTYVNAAFERLTGYDAEAALGRNCRFLQGPETDPEAVAALRAAIDEVYPTTVELLNYQADGTPWWNRVTLTPVHDTAGELSHFLGFQEDVTERVELERSEREEHELLEGLFEASPAGILVLDTAGGIIRANEAAETVLGLDRSTLLGREYDAPTWEIRDERGEQIPSSELPFSRALRGESVAGYEHAIVVDSEERWLDINAVPWYGDDGEVEGVLTAVGDVTARRREAHERERLLERFETVQSLADIGTWEFDAREKTWGWSTQTYRIFGVDPETFELTDETILACYHPEDRAVVSEATKTALEDGDPYDVEVRVEVNGEERWVHIHAAPLIEDGVPVGLLGGVQDVTQRKARERRLTVFDRVLRHNLRNKLNVVQGYAGTLAEADDQPPEAAVREILAAVDDLIGLSEKVRRFDSAVRPLNAAVATVDIAAGVGRVVREVKAAHPEVTVETTFPAAAWGRAHEAVEVAIEELLENAIAHTDEAAAVSVTVEDRHDEDVVEVRVADTGPGIPEMERRVLLSGTETPLEHMEGIGLWLVNWTVTSSGGAVDIQENDPRGSVVVLRFPRVDPPVVETADRLSTGAGE
jgi:PAS domain S-box-containing protein